VRDEVRNGEWERAGAYDAAAAQFAVPAAQRLVERSRLHDTLAACLGSTVTLVSAPAGWGKTMLVASWLSARPPDYPCVWITVSATDDDPRSFWLTVATGLASSVGEPVVTALRDVRAAAATELPGRIAAALTAAGPVLLVLDNLHELRSAAVHDGLLRLVDRPPKGLRVVATTRQDPPWPLDRLRIAGVLRTVSSEELAFRPEEAGAMLSTAGTELAPDLLGELLERTEGWAAALRLAALELAVSRDAAALVATFSGDDHSVAGYLLTEVLARAAPPARDLLGKICVLDLVCADLADAVTGGSDGAVRLAELEASNLFVHSVGRPGRWYQLHRLVADVLRGQLTDPRQRRDLHRRAAEWHRQQGMPLEAVRYALRGGLWRLAADIVGVHVVPLTVVGSARALDLELSSAPREVVWAHPELACGLAAARLMQGLGEEVGDLLGAARAGLADLPSSPARRTGVVLDLIEAGYGRYAGDLGQVIAACRRVPDDIPALRSLGLVDWPLLRIVTLSNLGAAQTWTGEHLEAEKHLRAAIETERWGRTLLPHLNAKAHLALLHYERGDLGAAEGDGLAAIDQANGLGWARTVQAAAAHLALAGVHLDRDELAAADEWLGWVADIDDITPEPHIQLVAAGWGAARRAATGELEQALVGLRAAIGRAERDPVPAPLTDRLLLLLSQLLCGRRDRRGAAAALAAVRDPESPEAVMGAARIQLLGDDPQGAQRLLDRIEPDGGSIRLQVARRVLMALAAEARDDADLALECLEEALLAAAPQRLRRPFLDVGAGLDRLLTMRIERGTEVAAFAVDLVQHASGQVPRPAAGPVEPLTTREQVVLRYLPSALSNAEIAAELYVSVNTVKSQQRTLYRKLAAEGRRDAVRRARELHLL
jgi:LuxR family maltose regulon positive regulatory protein